MAYGFAGHIGIGKETGWGSGVAATDYVEALSENVTLSLERFSYKAIIGSMAEPDDAVGLRRVAGSIKGGVHAVSIGYFLKSVLHSSTVTSGAGGLQTHVFVTTAGGSDFSPEVPHQPYSIEVFRDVTTSVRYTGCVVNALTLSYSTEGAVMFDANILGRGAEAIAKTTPTFPTSPAKPFTFDQVSLSLGGTATALIENLSIEINNDFEGIGALNNSLFIAKVRRKNHQAVNIKGTIDFTDLAEYNKFVNQTEQRLVVACFAPSSFSMVVDIPRMVYTAFPLGIPGKDRITVSFEGKGFYHQGSGNAIRVSLVNMRTGGY